MGKILVFEKKGADGSAFVASLISLIETPGSGWEIGEKSEQIGSEDVTFHPVGKETFFNAYANAHQSNQIFVHYSLVPRIKKLLKDFDQQVLIVVE
jgi:hypothetical protein